MTFHRYILQGHEPMVCEDLLEWARWFDIAENRIIAQTHLTSKVWVSTVFLGIDHNFWEGPPLLFETMIFGGAHDGYQTRNSSWDGSILDHGIALGFARTALGSRLKKRIPQTRRFTDRNSVYAPGVLTGIMPLEAF